MSLALVLEPLISAVDSADEWEEIAVKSGNFFKNTEESINPSELCEAIQSLSLNAKWHERFLLGLLHTGPSDIQTASRALSLSRVRRLLLRARRKSTCTEGELALANELLDKLNLHKFSDLLKLAQQSMDDIRLLMNNQEVDSKNRETAAYLIDLEARALKERINWITDNVDPYNMRAMGRILPRLRVHDETIQEGKDLAKKLRDGDPVGRPIMTLINTMRLPVFEKWIKQIKKSSKLKSLYQVIDLQKEKLIAPRDLTALATLCRWSREAEGSPGSPLEWYATALQNWNKGQFKINLGQSAEKLNQKLKQAGVTLSGTMVSGDFANKSFPDFIGPDMCTRPIDPKDISLEMDFHSLVRNNITRESVLERLIENPRVLSSTGLVAFVATVCKSISVLSKIASQRHLYSGHGNSEVPLALLQNPTRIPLSLLRPFVNTRYIALLDLRSLAKRRIGIRNEVLAELDEYLKTRE